MIPHTRFVSSAKASLCRRAPVTTTSRILSTLQEYHRPGKSRPYDGGVQKLSQVPVGDFGSHPFLNGSRNFHRNSKTQHAAVWTSDGHSLLESDHSETSQYKQNLRVRRSSIPEDLRFPGLPFKSVKRSSGSKSWTPSVGGLDHDDDDISFPRDLLDDIDFITNDSDY
eukprot:Nitzschia sp. Nitz4//scaffold177_size45885//31567//32070//NITZ4_007209-RA/size45885-processed-gene-0.70-mRNA-1//1//CDS//3329539067//3211//frame0